MLAPALPSTAPLSTAAVCWQGGFDAHLCCTCGFPGCWPASSSSSLIASCCAGESGGIAAALLDGNTTAAEGRALLCQPEAAKCLGKGYALTDPTCAALVQYVAGLGYQCRERITGLHQCARGIAVARWTSSRFIRRRRGTGTQASATAEAASVAEATAAAARGESVGGGKYGRLSQAASLECMRELTVLRETRRAYQLFFEAQEEAGTANEEFPDDAFSVGYVAHLRRCKAVRCREMHSMLEEASRAFWGSQGGAVATANSVPGAQSVASPRIGVIMALAPHESRFYARTLDVWHCYCAHHGDCEVVVETEDFLPDGAYPFNAAYDPAAEGGFRLRIGKAWNRWFALQKHLGYSRYEWLFTADPDQFPSQQCFRSVPLSEALRGVGESGHVVVRDFADFQTLNSAGVLFRNGAPSRLFLDLLFGKMFWDGFADFDQSAFDQTVIEFQELYYASAPGVARDRVEFSSPYCLVRQVKWVDGKSVLQHYFSCWHEVMQGWLGPFGARKTGEGPLRFLDPRELDLNYVAGGRSMRQTPLVWHLAGQNKHGVDLATGESVLDATLRSLWNQSQLPEGAGLSGERRNCRFWRGAARRSRCSPGTEVLDCRVGNLATC
mmetsp:Transcript_96334/g.272417  ORF Transcript_96334/g.272417 Transcript_96334/m.272417 type:complete len:612 (-) Transcript_96334:143-1978(-)